MIERQEQISMLVASAQTVLRARISVLLGGSADVEDVLQETNLAILRKAAEYDPSRPFMPWALQFAQLQCLKWRTLRSRDRLVFDGETFSRLCEETSVEAEPGLLREMLEKCLREDKIDAEMLYARYVDGLGTREIAARYGMTYTAARSRIQRLREKLMAKLKAMIGQSLTSTKCQMTSMTSQMRKTRKS